MKRQKKSELDNSRKKKKNQKRYEGKERKANLTFTDFVVLRTREDNKGFSRRNDILMRAQIQKIPKKN